MRSRALSSHARLMHRVVDWFFRQPRLEAIAMVLDRGPIGRSRALSLWLCTGPTRPAEWELAWVVAKRAPRRHRLWDARIRERAGRAMPYADPYRDGSCAVKNPIRQG